MSKNLIFLTRHNEGISRAEKDAAGDWNIEFMLNDLQVTCLAEDPLNPGVIYAGTRGFGLWRSTDKGKTWHHRGLDGESIMSVAVSPHSSQNTGIDQALVYAGTKPAHMFRSNDAGSSWEELTGFRQIPNRWWWFSPADPPDKRPYIISIGLSPKHPDVILAGVEFGAVVRSDDGGKSWSRHLRGTLRDCHSLMFHPSDENWAYQAGGTGGGASFSHDGGITWQKAKQGLEKSYGIVCAADPEKPEVWYICVGSNPYNAFGDDPNIYLYRSTAGAGWKAIGWTTHPLKETPTSLVTIPETPGELYAGLKNGNVWHSKDYGDTWEKMPFNLGGSWFHLLILNG
jgi:photosystem II stability/assembly factor-like uncharacterized protein